MVEQYHGSLGYATFPRRIRADLNLRAGIATIGQGLVRNFEGLVAMRVLVGLFEAGLFP